MNSPGSTWELGSPSRPASPTESALFAPRRLQDAPRRWRHQLAADQVDSDQREGAEGPRPILGHAGVAHVREAPQPLDHVERVLPAGTGPRPRPIDGAPARAQWPVGIGGSPIHRYRTPWASKACRSASFQYAW